MLSDQHTPRSGEIRGLAATVELPNCHTQVCVVIIYFVHSISLFLPVANLQVIIRVN